jgi:DNA-binding TFAR19-related protein (PDSD5 family)
MIAFSARTQQCYVYEGEAKQRVDRIRIVKPEKARAVEDMLVQQVR